jgi:tetratricopeptide (TPR) repeat protein
VAASSPEVNEAMDAIKTEDFAEAKRILTPVVAKDPGDVQAVFYLGVAEAALKETDAAIGHFQKAIELDPKFGDASLNLSALLLDLQRYDEAVAVAEQGLKHAPDDLGLLQNKALALSYGGQQAAAVAPLKVVVEKKPEDEGMRFLLAEALLASGDAAAARVELGKLEGSSSREVLASIADLYGRMKQWDACVAALNAAIGKEPAAELLITRGLCKHGKDDENGAKADFEAALQLDPASAKAHFYLGHNLRGRGDKKGAKAAFLKAAELAGAGPLAAQAKAAASKL